MIIEGAGSPAELESARRRDREYGRRAPRPCAGAPGWRHRPRRRLRPVARHPLAARRRRIEKWSAACWSTSSAATARCSSTASGYCESVPDFRSWGSSRSSTGFRSRRKTPPSLWFLPPRRRLRPRSTWPWSDSHGSRTSTISTHSAPSRAYVLRYVDSTDALGDPDAVILPGTKSTAADLAWLRATGLSDAIVQFAHRGAGVVGICGGFQMLGTAIRDPDGVESTGGDVEGLGLLPGETTFAREKSTHRVRAQILGGSGWLRRARRRGRVRLRDPHGPNTRRHAPGSASTARMRRANPRSTDLQTNAGVSGAATCTASSPMTCSATPGWQRSMPAAARLPRLDRARLPGITRSARAPSKNRSTWKSWNGSYASRSEAGVDSIELVLRRRRPS